MPSSVIDDFEYDADIARLTVWFLSGRVYDYRDVPEDVAIGLASAVSQGAYFNRWIRDRYAFTERLSSK